MITIAVIWFVIGEPSKIFLIRFGVAHFAGRYDVTP